VIDGQRLAHAPDLLQACVMWCRGTYRAQRATGLVLLAGAFGCGGRAGSDRATPDPAPAASGTTSTPPETSAGSPRPAPLDPPEASSSPAAPPTPAEDTDLDEIVDFVAPIDLVLRAHCGSCHGSSAPVEGSGGIRFMDDVDQLVAAGLIVPLNSAASRIVQVSVLGSMPPPSSGLARMPEADLQVIVSFIDNPRFWPEPVPSDAVDAGTALPAVDAGADGG
jgi:hypothetical protein